MHYRSVMAVLCVVAAALLPGAPAAAEPTAAPTIASYNVFMLARSLYPNWGQVTRADLITAQGVVADQDVVVLQEAFDNDASDRLLSNLAATHPHQTPVLGRSRGGWDATEGSYSATTPEDGGVAIVSRWPITRKIQYIYADACGADWWSNKGFVYVELAAPGGPLHVIGTHAQSEDDGCSAGEPRTMRSRQRAELRQFLAARNIPASQPVYVAGDLNVIEASDEYPQMLSELGAVRPEHTGHPHSWDCRDNSVCLDQYGADYASEHLDYVLPIAGSAVPSRYVNETRRVKSPEWSVTSWGKTYRYVDYSDHYPVFGRAG
ncbi:sphingomyelin phosphodiesterase [Nocardia otitidiscaviarum]|uniref:sphingomyelin phosphodiesterase n=1 Tax=Nocardia otitidiscaviarum TaxID=1823 RepID=UPI001892F044|nr:sphingomyelin phosphodiesterase [Nocardia otitidiscaviarum]MBF6134480.1 sphingomyelin phosphodiesterase [Nocardia otitidiscaviarum]